MKCSRCGHLIEDETRVYMKCPGVFEHFSDGVHRAIPEDVEEIWHFECDEVEPEDDED